MERNVGWMQLIAFFFPFWGILYSAALVARNDEAAAKKVVIVAVVSSVIQGIPLFLLFIRLLLL